jgi:hypothetical protein
MVNDENQFLEAIDCNFPYNDRVAAEDLIKKAATISDEALFAVLFEIVKLPKSASGKKEMQKSLLKTWERVNKSPLAIDLLPLINKKLDGELITVSSVLEVLECIRPYKNSYSALNLVSSLAYDETIEERYDEISKGWSNL